MQRISLKYSRLIHNAIVFTISLFISFYSHIPFAFWVSATVLAIMLPMDSQQIKDRITGVFWGTIQGLILFIPIWLILDINSGLIFLIIPLSLAAANFFQIHNFSRNIAFLNINLGLFLEYMQYGNYHFSGYFVARLMTIIIGIILAGCGDFFFTHRKNYATQEFFETVKKLQGSLAKLLEIFNDLHRTELQQEHEYTIINHINEINTLAAALANNMKSILLEQSSECSNQISEYYKSIPADLNQYKMELFALGYAVSSRLVVTEYRLNNLLVNLQHISDKLTQETNELLKVNPL